MASSNPLPLLGDENEELWINLLADSLARNVVHYYSSRNGSDESVGRTIIQDWATGNVDTKDYPSSSSTEDAVVSAWLREIEQLIRFRREDSSQEPANDEYVQRLARKVSESALARMDTLQKQAKQPPQKSSSGGQQSLLFDKDGRLIFQHSTPLVLFDLEDSPWADWSDEKRLSTLKGLDSFRDISVPSWNNIVVPFLVQGLARPEEDVKTLPFLDVWERFLSMSVGDDYEDYDYKTVQIDMARQLLSHLFTESEEDAVRIKRMVGMFLNRWMEWTWHATNRHVGDKDVHNEKLYELVRFLWLHLYRTLTTDPETRVRNEFIRQDAKVEWFTRWMASLSRDVSPVLDVIRQSDETGMMLANVVSHALLTGSSDEDQRLQKHSLYLVAGILRQTRVSGYPWEDVTATLNSRPGSNPTTTPILIRNLFDCYLLPVTRYFEIGKKEDSPEYTEFCITCLDMLETLVCGCRSFKCKTASSMETEDDASLAVLSEQLYNSLDTSIQAILSKYSAQAVEGMNSEAAMSDTVLILRRMQRVQQRLKPSQRRKTSND